MNNRHENSAIRKDSVKTNIQGLVDRLELPHSKGMMPLFEAISNAIDAIEEHKDGFLNHTITVQLYGSNDMVRQAGDGTFILDGFDIIDDGVGFTDKNIESFKEAHTLKKVSIGGKGVGRFTLLKVFSHVSIDSVFKDGNQLYQRMFQFSINNDLEEDNTPAKKPVNGYPIGTKVSVRGLNEGYRKGWPNDPNVIAERIISHFLIRFAGQQCPKIIFKAPNIQDISLQNLFAKSIVSHIQECFFDIEQHRFFIQTYRQPNNHSRTHDLTLCANSREVVTNKLKQILPELPDKLLDKDQKPYSLIILVTGEYLDKYSNQERTKISFEIEEQDDVEGNTLISRQTLNKGIAAALRPLLADDLKITHQEKLEQIESFVSQEAPEYRALTHPRYKELLEQNIPPGLSNDKLDEALLHLRRRIEDEVGKEARHVAKLFEKQTFDQYQVKFKDLAERINDVGKAQLAAYIAHRRTILDLVDHSLKKSRTDDKYPLEKVLHKMIFPMGVTSKDVFFEQQNLWLIDERLSYHTLLTSDKKLNSIKGLENSSGKEPDVFGWFYDTPIGVAEPDNTSGGIVVIEFKRPGRDDYQHDPSEQIIYRFGEISEGGVKDIDGRPINPANLRFSGYLIADITPSLRKRMGGRYSMSADGESYFFSLTGGNGFVEIISYDKLVKNAKQRNRILFDKLGVHK